MVTARQSGFRRRVRALLRRGRTPGLRTAKTTLAAVLSYVAADTIGTTDKPVLAPLTALLVVQLTMYQTLANGLERVASVLAGVLVAVGVAAFVGLTWWSLGAVVAISLILGRLLRLGPQLLEVPISAMLVLAVGGAREVAAGRVYETLIGAAVGVAVNVAIAPPLYLQPAGDAVGELADRMAAFLRQLAGQLREAWSRELADRWLNEARVLGHEVGHAERALARAEESARFNPRGRQARAAQPRLNVALTALGHCHVTMRSLCRSLLDRTYFVPPEEEATAYDDRIRQALGDALDAAAGAIERVPGVASGAAPVDVARGEVEIWLARLHEARDRLADLLLVDPRTDAAAWEQHGALLAALDRMRVEVEAAVRPTDAVWRPPPVTGRPREAVRRVLDTSRKSGVMKRRRRP